MSFGFIISEYFNLHTVQLQYMYQQIYFLQSRPIPSHNYTIGLFVCSGIFRPIQGFSHSYGKFNKC